MSWQTIKYSFYRAARSKTHKSYSYDVVGAPHLEGGTSYRVWRRAGAIYLSFPLRGD